jgi:transposase
LKIIARRELRRGDVLKFFKGLSPCLVGLEACGTAHHWAREIAALGHTVKLMPPAYVKPYVKRGKTDAGDAEAICEAVTRPTIRFVAIKTVDQQAALMLHKTRDLLVRQPTILINGLRGHLAEFGLIAAKGPAGVKAAIEALREAQEYLPEVVRLALHGIVDQLRQLGTAIERLEARIVAWHRASDVSRRLQLFLASDRSPRSRPRCRMGRCSDPGGSLPLGSVRHRGRTAAEEKSGRWESASRATATSAGCSSSGRLPSCVLRATTTPAEAGR